MLPIALLIVFYQSHTKSTMDTAGGEQTLFKT